MSRRAPLDSGCHSLSLPHGCWRVIASQAGRALRDLRKIAEGAKNDLREGLGPEFADFEIDDLNPKRFVQKHLFDDMNGNSNPVTTSAAAEPARANGTMLAPGERPPFDPDAT